jgi:hypothetical protein
LHIAQVVDDQRLERLQTLDEPMQFQIAFRRQQVFNRLELTNAT